MRFPSTFALAVVIALKVTSITAIPVGRSVVDARDVGSYGASLERRSFGDKLEFSVRDLDNAFNIGTRDYEITLERRLKAPTSILRRLPKIKPAPKTHVDVPKPHIQVHVQPNPPHRPPINQAQQKAKSDQEEEAKEAAELSGIHDNDSQLRQ